MNSLRSSEQGKQQEPRTGAVGGIQILVHQTQRGGRQAALPAPSAAPVVAHHAPHAALLIDFDNVTLGIRSDLTKELKTLLNSEIIRGKVAVRRAYADWRRYPQYIVPLSERSIDLIFATAVGSTKKNATDIRLAIDAMELVFTRPEIGTFILLSGDSDFSSLVIKLKEYGKYVVGVGIRESASDFLIQNCDEYYSYSELAGLSKETDSTSAQRDPWELVGEAVLHMARHGDVMRSDRLKQVMQQLDPNFDERNVGFNRFSKFVAEAGTRGLLTISKLDNGQYEVAAVTGGREAPAPTAAPTEERGGDAGRRGGRNRRGRGRGREDRPAPAAASTGSAPAPAPTAPPSVDRLTLAGAFALMNRALGELPNPVQSEALRARMAALHGREDQMLDADKFERLLRQANDAEIADVRRISDTAFEVSLSRLERARLGVDNGSARSHGQPQGANGTTPAADTAEEPAAGLRPAMLRFRRGSRSVQRPNEIPLIGMVDIAPEPAPAAEPEAAPEPAAKKPRGRGKAAKPAAVPAADAEPVAAPAAKRASRGRGRGK